MWTHFGTCRRPRFRFSLRVLLVLPVLCALGCLYWIALTPERHWYWVGLWDVTLDILVKDADSGQPIPGAVVRVTGPSFGLGIAGYDKESTTALDGHARIQQDSSASAEMSAYRSTYRMKGRVIFNQWLEIARAGYETRTLFLSDFVGRTRSFDQLPPPGFAIELRKGPARDPRLAQLAGRYGPQRGTDSDGHGGSLEILPDGRFHSETIGVHSGIAASWSHYAPIGLIRCEESELLFTSPRGYLARFDQPRKFILVRTNDGIYIVPKEDVEKFRAELVNGQLPDSSEFNVNCAFKPHSSSPSSSLTSSHGF
jgi:hypothetical protein